MSATDRITTALGAVLAPAGLAGQALLEAFVLTGEARFLVESAVRAAWEGHEIELAWEPIRNHRDGRIALIRVYLLDVGGSRSVGTVKFLETAGDGYGGNVWVMMLGMVSITNLKTVHTGTPLTSMSVA